MANNHEFSSETEDSDWDDLEGDPDFEETDANFSNLSLTTNKSKSQKRVVECKGLEDTEDDSEVLDIAETCVDDASFKKVEAIINAGQLEKLKVDECKLYLRKNSLRLTGNKDVLIQRIKEHQEIINGGGEKKYPPSSFVLNCKGDACVGDVVLFEQNVYEMFNIASRSASGPPCGTRVVAGRIVKESYGAAKQQHTFTIEVLWSKGEKPFSPLHPLLIKGRNLYRLKTLRQKWEDEGKRHNILMEKHSRGCVARAQREARIQEKEKRKAIRESYRVSKKDLVRNQNQYQTLPTKPTPGYYPQETDTSINPEKPAFPSDNTRKERPSTVNKPSHYRPQETKTSINPEKLAFPSENKAFSANTRQEMLSTANKPAVVTKPYGKSIDSGRVSLSVHPQHNHQHHGNYSADYRCTYDVNHIRKAEHSSNYIHHDLHYREERFSDGRYHHSFNAETNRFTEWVHHTSPLRSADHFPPLMNNREERSMMNYIHHDLHYREERFSGGRYHHPLNDETNRFTEWVHHRSPLRSANHFPPLMNNRENYKQKQLCRHYARGWCRFGDNCKFLHDLD